MSGVGEREGGQVGWGRKEAGMSREWGRRERGRDKWRWPGRRGDGQERVLQVWDGTFPPMAVGVPLCCARSKTRIEPDFDPAARHSSGSLKTTDSTGDVCPVKLCPGINERGRGTVMRCTQGGTPDRTSGGKALSPALVASPGACNLTVSPSTTAPQCLSTAS